MRKRKPATPTIGFDLLYAFVIVRLGRRELVWTNVTANPTAEWVARQLTEAFPWDEAPHYLIRDRDRICGSVVTRRRHGHPGQAYRTSFALAEWLCRTADRIDPARVCRPHHRLGRGTFAPNSEILRRLLQYPQNAPILEQGYAGFSPGSANRCDQFTRNPGRTSSPLRPCLSFRYTQPTHLHEEPAVAVSRLDAAPHPPPQDDQLMSEHRILCLKPALRLERRGQHGQNKTEQPDHSASLGDSSLNKPG
jgi:hypothetical protein